MTPISDREATLIDWLLDSDPSIRWKVMRDLTHEPKDVIAAERSRIAIEGRGARLLALQAPDGRWGGRPWSVDYTDTFHVLELLRLFGLDPESDQARRAVGLVREHVTWRVPEFETPWADNRLPAGDGTWVPAENERAKLIAGHCARAPSDG